MNSTAQDLGRLFSSQGTRTIGALAFWTLANVDVTRAEFREAMAQVGLGAAVPRDPRPDTCLTTAVKKTLQGSGSAFERRLGNKRWAIVLESQERESQALRHAHAATVCVGEEGKLVWKAKGSPEQLSALRTIGAEIEVRFRDARERLDTSDMSTVMTNAMHGTTKDQLVGAVSLRERTGGLYFVHASKLDLLRRLKTVVEGHAPACAITIMTITGEADNLAAAAAAAKQSFQAQLAELRGEISQFKADLAGRPATERNVDVRVARFALLRDRVELFSDVLGDVARELCWEIDDAKSRVAQELGL